MELLLLTFGLLRLHDLQRFSHVSRSLRKPLLGYPLQQEVIGSPLIKQQVITVRKIILATGVTDHLLPIEGLQALWGKKVFHCTYCHGWEAGDQPHWYW